MKGPLGAACTNHLARDGKLASKCAHWDSDRHLTALHSGRFKLLSSDSRQGTVDCKLDRQPPLEVSSKCTEVCG